MHPAECASEIKGTVALRSAGGFGRLSVQARNGFRRLSAGGLNDTQIYKTKNNNCSLQLYKLILSELCVDTYGNRPVINGSFCWRK